MLSVSATGNADASAKPVAITSAPAAPQAQRQLHEAGLDEGRQAASASAGGIEAIKQVTLAQNGDKTEVNVPAAASLNYHVTRLQQSRSHRARFLAARI